MEVRERVMHIIFTAFQVANPRKFNEPTKIDLDAIGQEIESIYKGVQGNRPNGYPMPPEDQLIMLERALRRAVEIVDEAQKAVRA